MTIYRLHKTLENVLSYSRPWLEVKVKVLVAQSCLTLCNSMVCILTGSSVHGILQARILEWVAIPFSRGSSQPRDWTQVSCIAGRFFPVWAIKRPCVGNMNIDQRKHRPKWIMKYPYGYTDLFLSLSDGHLIQMLTSWPEKKRGTTITSYPSSLSVSFMHFEGLPCEAQEVQFYSK